MGSGLLRTSTTWTNKRLSQWLTVSKTKCRTPLIYATKENSSHEVRIHYEICPDHTQRTPFYITIRNKATNKKVTKLIDNFNILWVPHFISKIKLSKDRVEIKGGAVYESTLAVIWIIFQISTNSYLMNFRIRLQSCRFCKRRLQTKWMQTTVYQWFIVCKLQDFP